MALGERTTCRVGEAAVRRPDGPDPLNGEQVEEVVDGLLGQQDCPMRLRRDEPAVVGELTQRRSYCAACDRTFSLDQVVARRLVDVRIERLSDAEGPDLFAGYGDATSVEITLVPQH